MNRFIKWLKQLDWFKIHVWAWILVICFAFWYFVIRGIVQAL